MLYSCLEMSSIQLAITSDGISRYDTYLLMPCSLTGSIPDNIGNASLLSSFQLYNNSLSGTIPPSIFRIGPLQSLNLANNSLHGPIPESVTWVSGHDVWTREGAACMHAALCTSVAQADYGWGIDCMPMCRDTSLRKDKAMHTPPCIWMLGWWFHLAKCSVIMHRLP